DQEIPGSDPVEPASGFKLFVQPGGLSSGAENRGNLPSDYYEKMLGSMPAWRARRLIHNQWGYSRDGKPVYPEFNDAVHVAAARLDPLPRIPVGIGIDAGGTPAAVFGQFCADGQMRVFAEIVSGPGTGPKRFGDEILRVRNERCRSHDIYAWADPSAAYGGDADGGDPAWLETVARRTRIHMRPAPTNAPGMRQEAVRSHLSRLVEGRPGFQMCPTMKIYRKAMNSGYHFRRIKIHGATGRFGPKPEKNEFSHVAEAGEYLALGGAAGLASIIGRDVRNRAVTVDSTYDELGV
ncbi:MAG: hypothetical protein ACK4TG_11020, partial [Thermaurantiacus sp.]